METAWQIFDILLNTIIGTAIFVATVAVILGMIMLAAWLLGYIIDNIKAIVRRFMVK